MGKSFNKNTYNEKSKKSSFNKLKNKIRHAQRNNNKNLINDELKIKEPNEKHQKFRWAFQEPTDYNSLNDKYNVGTKQEWNNNNFTSQKELIQHYIVEKEKILENFNNKEIENPKYYYKFSSNDLDIVKTRNEILELKKINKQLIRRNKNGVFKGHKRDNSYNFI
tara:strand:- start:118 stop:612 length:495 start_codon:yes stop_codon:yes gene_type:complete